MDFYSVLLCFWSVPNIVKKKEMRARERTQEQKRKEEGKTGKEAERKTERTETMKGMREQQKNRMTNNVIRKERMKKKEGN